MAKLVRSLLLVFIAYLSFLFIFGYVYYSLFRQQPDRHFAFNADILRRQREVFRLASDEEVRRLQLLLGTLQRFINALNSGTYSAKRGTGEADFFLESGEHLIFTLRDKKLMPTLEGEPQGWEPSFISLAVTDRNGQNVVEPLTITMRGLGRVPSTDSDFGQLVTDFSKQTQIDLGELLRRQATLTGPSPEAWSYWDFFYFSSISQTTVGYGDILPNSTVVRMLVVLQVLIGYLLFVVVLNVVVSSK